MRASRILWIGLAAALGLSPGGCDRASGADKSKQAGPGRGEVAAVPVRTRPIVSRRIDRQVEISGSLASPDDSTIAAEVEGKVVSLKVDLGDQVREGQILARINPDEYRFRMEQAEAQAQQAQSNLRRIEQLAKNEMVAPRELDDARAQAAQTKAAADLARKKFADTEVRAPFRGAVARRLVSAGEYVKVGQPLFEIVLVDPLKLTGEVPERHLQVVHQGDEVQVSVDAFPGQVFSGKLSRISPAVRPESRSFTVEARIANDKGQLKPGVFAHARLRVGTAEDALCVPEAALSAFAGVTRLFVIEGGVAHERRVEVDQHLPDDTVAVHGEGLRAGQEVAVAGLGRLAEGVPVMIPPAPPPTAPGAPGAPGAKPAEGARR